MMDYIGLYFAILLASVIFFLLFSGMALLGMPEWVAFLLATSLIAFIFHMMD